MSYTNYSALNGVSSDEQVPYRCPYSNPRDQAMCYKLGCYGGCHASKLDESIKKRALIGCSKGNPTGAKLEKFVKD